MIMSVTVLERRPCFASWIELYALDPRFAIGANFVMASRLFLGHYGKICFAAVEPVTILEYYFVPRRGLHDGPMHVFSRCLAVYIDVTDRVTLLTFLSSPVAPVILGKAFKVFVVKDDYL